MFYATKGGSIIQAQNNEELLYKLSQQSIFGNKDDVKNYMNTIANASIHEYNLKIRTDSVEHFISDLIKYGYLIEMDEKKLPK